MTMMIAHPTYKVGIRLSETGPGFTLRVPEPDLRTFTAVLVFNQANFSVAKEDDPFEDAKEDFRQSVSA